MRKKICLWIFSILSIICFLGEFIEIIFCCEIWWSDHLHNLIDHLMYLVINYIGFKTIEEME